MRSSDEEQAVTTSDKVGRRVGNGPRFGHSIAIACFRFCEIRGDRNQRRGHCNYHRKPLVLGSAWCAGLPSSILDARTKDDAPIHSLSGNESRLRFEPYLGMAGIRRARRAFAHRRGCNYNFGRAGEHTTNTIKGTIMVATYWMALALALSLTVIAQVVLKIGAGRNGSAVNFVTASGLAMFGVVTVLSVYALQGLELKTVIAWNSMTFVAIPLAAYFFLDERLSKRHLMGASIICTGVAVFSFA